MRERPIIFSGEMVKAILDGRKSQTRRVIKPQPTPFHDRTGADYEGEPWMPVGGVNQKNWLCPYGVPGDRLWVRETWQKYGDGIAYRASAPFEDNRNWKPPIHMPRRASRITLEITGVRAERLQDISENDAQAEGIVPIHIDEFDIAAQVTEAPDADISKMMQALGPGTVTARGQFISAWNKINGKKHPWASNPWVWVIEFRRISDE